MKVKGDGSEIMKDKDGSQTIRVKIETLSEKDTMEEMVKDQDTKVDMVKDQDITEEMVKDQDTKEDMVKDQDITKEMKRNSFKDIHKSSLWIIIDHMYQSLEWNKCHMVPRCIEVLDVLQN